MANNIRKSAGRQSKWGICMNPSCPNYRQKIEIERGELICPDENCKKPLSPCAPPTVKKSFFEKYGKQIGIGLAVIVVLAAIGFGIYKLVGPSQITAVKLDKKTLKLKVGQRELLTASVEPEGSKATYIWKSSDKSVVSVEGGEVTALKKGKATITVKVEENTELRGVTCKIEVEDIDEETSGKGDDEEKPVLVTSLAIGGGDFTLTEGETKQLAAQPTPVENDESVAWASSDENVATVSADGQVTAVAAGTATITAATSKSNTTASVTVTVKAKKQDGPTGNGGGKNTGATSTNSRSLSLGYATYSGDMKNGKMDGAGVLTFKQRHLAGRDFKSGEQVYAEAGERIDGIWNNGYLSSGTLFKKDGNAIKIKY